jgi:RecB family exonuclease
MAEIYISYSRLSTYLACPYRFYLQYVEGCKPPANAQMIFGSSLHAALRDFYTQERIPPTLDDLYSHFCCNWLPFGYPSRESQARFFQEGLSILKDYYDRNIEGFQPALFAEKKFRVLIKGIALVGIVDRIDQLKGGGYRVVDYKTHLKSNPDRLQLTLYYMALGRIFKGPPEELLFYFLKEQEALPVLVSPVMLEEAQESLFRMKEGLEQKLFPKNKGESCLSCDFQRFCKWEEASGYLEEP